MQEADEEEDDEHIYMMQEQGWAERLREFTENTQAKNEDDQYKDLEEEVIQEVLAIEEKIKETIEETEDEQYLRNLKENRWIQCDKNQKEFGDTQVRGGPNNTWWMKCIPELTTEQKRPYIHKEEVLQQLFEEEEEDYLEDDTPDLENSDGEIYHMEEEERQDVPTIRIARTERTAIMPSYKSDGAAGMDIAIPIEVNIEAQESELVNTHLVFEIPEGYYRQITQ